ncbi:hypothetical protein [Cyclobacterium salsum]|uniref:hypothetical protein n=1 Tax=Cyclobacterium salsum TaxID=2666329 RepID=UPI00139112AA|nr:hypothetical protein [Cyclobacterium salsum]
MAITITQAPPALCFAGNLPDIIVTTDDPGHDFSITIGGDLLLEEYYTADAAGNITIPLRMILEDQLSMLVPDTDSFIQSGAVKDIECLLGDEEIDFRIVRGGVDRPDFNTSDFLFLNWLTWQPQTKQVRYRDPEYLSYYAIDQVTVKVKAFFENGSDNTADAYILTAGSLHTVNVTFEKIHSFFDEQPLYFDVWIQNADEGENTWRQRYVLTDQVFEFDDLFVFENTLGGIDTIRFTGTKTLLNKQDFDTGIFFDEFELEYDINPDKAYEKNTGFFRSRRQLFWSQDFFSSMQKYLVQGNELRRVLTREPKFEAVRYDLIAFDFQFVFTRQVEYLDWVSDEPLDILVIIGPDQELYYLVPRMWIFPELEDPSDAIFPVQVAGEQEWKGLTFQTIMEYLRNELEIPADDRIIDPGVFEMADSTSGTLTGASWVRDGVTYQYTGPVVLADTPEAPDSRFDVIYTQPSNSVGYQAGTPSEDPVVPNPPAGEMVLHQILRLNSGENIISPQNPDSPETKNEAGDYELYAEVWRQDVQANTYYDFKIAYIGWASDYSSNRQRPLNGFLMVNFVTNVSNSVFDPNRIHLMTVDIAPRGGDFVLVQVAPTVVAIYVKKTAFYQTLTFDFAGPKSKTVSDSSLRNGQGYAELPAGARWTSRNQLDYLPTAGSTIRFDCNRSYGYDGTPLNFNMVIATAYANSGCMAKVLNNRSIMPSISVPSGVVLHHAGGTHVASEINEYLFICHKDNNGEVVRVSYTITQNQSS